MSTIKCTCCQAEITAPQFYNGFPYGYTCIKKVDPQFKRKQDTGLWAEVRITINFCNGRYTISAIDKDGRTYRSNNLMNFKGITREDIVKVYAEFGDDTSFSDDGWVRLSYTKDGSQPTFK